MAVPPKKGKGKPLTPAEKKKAEDAKKKGGKFKPFTKKK